METVAIAKAAEESSVGTALRNVAVDTATEGGGSIKEMSRGEPRGQRVCYNSRLAMSSALLKEGGK